jgi:hypothetical protein
MKESELLIRSVVSLMLAVLYGEFPGVGLRYQTCQGKSF